MKAMQPDFVARILNFNELPDYFDRVEARMIEIVSDTNPLIKEPLMRLINGLNKRFVVFLVGPVVKSQGKDIDDSVITSCAVLELLNMAFCIHDDVTDNSNKRYGVPNINAVEGVNQAILIGDYLLNLTVQAALTVSKEVADVVIKSIAENRESEIIEIADRHNLDRTIDAYLHCINLKSASHISATCQIGGICAGLPKTQIRTLATYGEAVGMMYQLLDDLLDFVSAEEIMRKPIGKDVEEGVYTLPLLLGLQGTDRGRIEALLKAIPQDEAASDELLQVLAANGSIEKTIQEIRDYCEQAAKALQGFKDNDIIRGLARFPSNYLDAALEYSAIKLHG